MTQELQNITIQNITDSIAKLSIDCSDGVFSLITNDGRADQMLMRDALIRQQITQYYIDMRHRRQNEIPVISFAEYKMLKLSER